MSKIKSNEVGAEKSLTELEEVLDEQLIEMKKVTCTTFRGHFPAQMSEFMKYLENSALFQIFQNMPKGALLHTHIKAITNELILEEENWTNLWVLGTIEDSDCRFQFSVAKPDEKDEKRWRPVTSASDQDGLKTFLNENLTSATYAMGSIQTDFFISLASFWRISNSSKNIWNPF